MSAGPTGRVSLTPVYARAVLGARRKGAEVREAAAAGRPLVLPVRAVVHPGAAVDAGRAAALALATGVPLGRDLPVTGPHLLAFAAQLDLLAAADFPLPLPGLVHVTQRVRQHRPLAVGERVEVRVSARGPLPHPKGAVVELDAVFTTGDEVVWEGTSGYLARRAAAPEVPRDVDGAALPLPAAPERVVALWHVPATAGRSYAAASGDVNPIHLSSLAARGFGFRGAIAHGMWTLARAVGQVAPQLGGAVEVRARFGSPLLLGSRAALCAEPVGDGGPAGAEGGGWALAVRSGTPLPGERLHLTAEAAPLRR